MPTAVEYIASLLQKALKLDAIDSPYALRQFSALDDAIDPGFQALNAAGTSRAFAAAEHQYGHVFQSLGDGSVALGFDLQRDAVVFNVVNQLLGGADIFGGGGGSGRVAEVWGGGGGSGRVADMFGGGGGSGRVAEVWGGGGGSGAVADIYGGGGGSGTQADFGVLDRRLFATGHDFETLGADLASLAHVNSPRTLGAVEARVRTDLSHLDDDFSSLSRGATAFASDIRIDNADIFGGGGGSGDLLRALAPIGEQMHAIASDFNKLAGGAGANDGGITAGDIFGGGGGSGFVALHGDLLTLDGSLQGLAAPLAGLLVPAVQTAAT